MGGTGSGRWWRWDRKTSLNECLSVDIRDWKRKDLLRPGLGFSWYWSINDQPAGSINVRAGEDCVVLSYWRGPKGSEKRSIEETVPLSFSKCHLGGRRVWFLCPGCYNRVARLFLASAYFRCRHCCQLPYASQQETPYDRALRRARKIRSKLGAGPGLCDPIRERPRGMHWRTFERLRAQAEEQDEIANFYFMRTAMKLIARHGP